jgi:hypothetical protein
VKLARAFAVACALAATSAAAVTPPAAPTAAPGAKLTSIYNLAHVGAILDICAANPETTPDTAKSKEIAELASRIFALVRTMGSHYRDAELPAVYASTKKQMAGTEKLQRHVHEAHRDCGERALTDLRAYVADNEAMIAKAIGASKAPPPAPPGK